MNYKMETEFPDFSLTLTISKICPDFSLTVATLKENAGHRIYRFFFFIVFWGLSFLAQSTDLHRKPTSPMRTPQYQLCTNVMDLYLLRK